MTSDPPPSCTGLSDSPKARKASTTVVTGSAVDRIDALVGPTRVRPAKNRLTAATDQLTAMAASQPKPVGLTAPTCRPPLTAVPTVRVAAAPVQTSALSRIGPTRS